jgi:hypothetical protein
MLAGEEAEQGWSEGRTPSPMTKPVRLMTTATRVVLEVETDSTHRDQGRPHGGRQSCPRVQCGGMTLHGWVGVMSPTNHSWGGADERTSRQELVTMLAGEEAEQGWSEGRTPSHDQACEVDDHGHRGGVGGRDRLHPP